MLDRLARVVRTEASVISRNASTLTVVSAYRWTPRWIVLHVARSWFTLDPGTPRLAGTHPTPDGRIEWHIIWPRPHRRTRR